MADPGGGSHSTPNRLGTTLFSRAAGVAALIALAPVTIYAAANDDGATGATTSPVPTTEVMSSGAHGAMTDPAVMVEIDDALIPPPAPGRPGLFIGPAETEPEYTDGIGAFRINCSYSHMSYDDPIVYPGEPGASHLHIFFGNTDVDADSTAESIRTTGDTTCTGGSANRSAYWVPAVIDTDTHEPVVPEGDNAVQVYYKTGYDGVPADQVTVMPEGLRMVSGDPTVTTPGDLSTVSYSCLGNRSVDAQPAFPECDPGDLFVMSVEFPQCWDGVNLDSPDHRSHMARAAAPDGCPASHPVAIPVITQNFRYTVPSSGMASWRLASDNYDGPAGYSGHADWFDGWDTDVFRRVVDNCLANGVDCHMNNLGDGERLE